MRNYRYIPEALFGSDRGTSLSGRARTQHSRQTVSLVEFEEFIYEALGLSHWPSRLSKRSLVLETLEKYASLADAVQVMRQERLGEVQPQSNTTDGRDSESCSLQSLVFICAVLLENEQESPSDPTRKMGNLLSALDAFLSESRRVWVDSNKDLTYLIWHRFAKQKECVVFEYLVSEMMEALKDVGCHATWAFEQCLLECLVKRMN